VIGVSVDGERDILGLWAGDGSEGAKFRLAVLTEIKNRGVEDVCIAVCDGLKGLPESITATWQYTQVQACILHLIRNTFRYASRADWEQLAKDLRPVYTAPTEASARGRFAEFAQKWGTKYPAIIRLWRQAWQEFIPFLDYGACRNIPRCSAASMSAAAGRSARFCRGVCASLPGMAAACSPSRTLSWCAVWSSRASLGASGSGCRVRSVDLHEVEGCGSEVKFAGGVVQAAA
jgi:putative transposase